MAHSKNPDHVILAGPGQLTGRLGRGVITEFADGDNRTPEQFQAVLGALATGNIALDAPPIKHCYQFAADAFGQEAEALGLRGSYEPFQPLPDLVAARIGHPDKQAHMLSWSYDRQHGEIVVECDPGAIPVPELVGRKR